MHSVCFQVSEKFSYEACFHTLGSSSRVDTYYLGYFSAYLSSDEDFAHFSFQCVNVSLVMTVGFAAHSLQLLQPSK